MQTAWPYAGLERDAEGIELEGGYLPAKCAASIKVLSETYPGHAGNIFSKYIYAELLSTETRGWFPVALLAPCGPCAWALVHSEHGKRVNGTMMQVMDWQPDKLLLQKLCGSQILVSKHKCHVFATPQLAEAGMRKRLLLRGHSDKQGDRHMFDLAMLFV